MTSRLTPRVPRFDFSDADPRWLPHAPSFAHEMNGASLLLPYLEPYLIRVMRAARPAIEARAPALLDDLDLFNRQEANHYRAHAEYNRILFAQYPGLERFDREIARDFERFLSDRSLAWNLAYSEGFESLGLASGEFVLEQARETITQGDARVAELWRWHLAEEIEHRSVAHDVLHALHPGWWRRVRGFVACSRHLFGFTGRVASFMLDLDIERGRLPADARTLDSSVAFERHRSRFMLGRVLRILRPGYDPAPRGIGPETARVLRTYDT